MAAISYRPATDADDVAIYDVFRESIDDLFLRLGHGTDPGGASAAEPPPDVAPDALWEGTFRSMFTHLRETSESCWLAVQDERVVGYARCILRGGERELTELFVRPGLQAAGVGRELLARGFEAPGADRKLILATLDPRAQARYLRAGTYPLFPLYSLQRKPELLEVADELEAEPLIATDDQLDQLAAIDADILGHRRDVDHRWLAGDRTGFLYSWAGGPPFAYGYTGSIPGPMATTGGRQPALLMHLEREAAAAGLGSLAFDVPGINRDALAHLIDRGYRVDRWVLAAMFSEPVGRYDQYVVTGPTFFV